MKTIKPKAKIKPVELKMTIKTQNAMVLDDKDIYKVECVNVNDSNIEMVKENNFVQEINSIEVQPIPISISKKLSTTELPETTTIEQMMDNILDNPKKEENFNSNSNLVNVSFTLTKRQHALFEKKGGVKWLKKKLVN